MKKLQLLGMLAISMTLMPQVSQAQGILKKLNKGLEKVNKTLGNATSKADLATGQASQQEDGVLVYNPLSKAIDIELVGAYGVSTSENFGIVELVLKVNVKIPESHILLGGDAGSKGTMAYDTEGNVYKMVYPSVGHDYDITEGLTVRIVMKGSDSFQKVPKSVTSFPVLKLFAHLNWDYRGEIMFKNVPVAWDVEH
ncbi:MAG: hypothetical protein IJ196_04940 [Prevotella sp.]|nr:hypothetical protein [Prevotella sp.]